MHVSAIARRIPFDFTTRLEKQSNAFKSFDSSLKYCERNEQSLEEESLQKFSVPETRRKELEKQLNDITVSEENAGIYSAYLKRLH